MRGRKPTPTATRKLTGNPQHRPFNDAEPVHPPPGDAFDAPPPELVDTPAAAAEWTRLAPMLRRARQVTAADRGALIAACLEWARYLDALAHVRAEGAVIESRLGAKVPNPYVRIAATALAACSKLWPELGLTPSSRSRVKTADDGGEDTPRPEGDAFSEFDEPMPPRAAH